MRYQEKERRRGKGLGAVKSNTGNFFISLSFGCVMSQKPMNIFKPWTSIADVFVSSLKV